MNANERNEHIAAWMGEVKCTMRGCQDYPDNMAARCNGCVDNNTSYDTDPAAALRVLERMNKSDVVGLHCNPEFSEEAWFCATQYESYSAPTPCTAICTAWEAEFGGEA